MYQDSDVIVIVANAIIMFIPGDYQRLSGQVTRARLEKREKKKKRTVKRKGEKEQLLRSLVSLSYFS